MFHFATNTSMSIFTHYLKHENWWHNHLALQIYIQTVPFVYPLQTKKQGYRQLPWMQNYVMVASLHVQASITYTQHGIDIIGCNTTHFIMNHTHELALHLDVVWIRTGKWGDKDDESDFYPENWWHCHIDNCKNGKTYTSIIYLDTHILHVY